MIRRINPPVLLVLHDDVVLRQRITEQIGEWCDGSIVTAGMAVSLRELKWLLKYETLRREGSRPLHLAAVLYDGNQTRQRKLKRAIRKCGYAGVQVAKLPNYDSFNRTSAQGEHLFKDKNAARNLQRAIEQLFHSWNSGDAEIFLEGEEKGDRAQYLQRFLFLHGISYQWKDDRSDNIRARLTRDGEEFKATLGEIYTKLILGEPTYDLAHPYDLVIVGAGPAGLSAGTSAGSVGLSTLVIETARPGGSAAMSINRIENYLGFPGGVTGTRLAKLAVEQLQAAKADLRPTVRATSIKEDPRNRYRYIIEVVDGAERTHEVKAGMILIACGQRPNTLKHPDHPDKDLEIPHTPGIRYVMEAHMAREVEGMDILIVGGGDSAGQAALLYKESGCASVTLVAKDVNDMSGSLYAELDRDRSIKVEYPATVVQFLETDDGLIETTVRRQTEGEHLHSTHRVHILIGGNPDTDWLEESPVELKKKFIQTDVHTTAFKERSGVDTSDDLPLPFHTSSPGIFAVGDARVNARRRVGQAVGQGVAAVAAMERYLRAEDKERGGCVWESVLSPDQTEEQSLFRRWREVISKAEGKGCGANEGAEPA